MGVAVLGRTAAGLDVVDCGLCGDRGTRPRYRKFGLPIVQCTRCGLVYANPRLPPEQLGRRYSREYFLDEYLPAIGAAGGRVDLDYVDRRYGPWVALASGVTGGAGRVFDIGAGAGLALKAFERSGWVVGGLEVNVDAVAFARDRLGLDVAAGDAGTLDVPGSSHDVVLMLDVVEHLADPFDVAGRARRLLRPGGALILQTPNYDSLSRRALGEPWAVLSPAEHLYYFTEATLARLLRAAGFTRVDFNWRFAGYEAFEVMNAGHTHAPGGWRSYAYKRAVARGGKYLLEWAVTHNATDQLICVAYA